MWNFLSEQLTKENGLIAIGLGILWRWIAGSKRGELERRVREAAAAAWSLTRTITGYTVERHLEAAKTKAHAMLGRLGLAGAGVEPLIDHELDVLAGEDAAQELPARLAELEAATRGVVDAFEPPKNPTVPRLELDFEKAPP